MTVPLRTAHAYDTCLFVFLFLINNDWLLMTPLSPVPLFPANSSFSTVETKAMSKPPAKLNWVAQSFTGFSMKKRGQPIRLGVPMDLNTINLKVAHSMTAQRTRDMYSRHKRRNKHSSTREQETPKATKEMTAVEQKISRRTNWGSCCCKEVYQFEECYEG